MERIIGEITGDGEGPLLIFIGGIHGNETTGISALEKVFNEFSFGTTQVKGRAIALRGNLEAIRQNIRYLSMDLNRIWDVKHFKRANDYHAAEVYELLELRRIIEKELKGDFSRAYLIDLHTTSAPTIPFLVTKDTPDNISFVENLDVPYVTGLIGYLDGTMLGWMCEKGHCGMAFESGQHHSRVSIIKHEAFVVLSMFYSGFMPDLSDSLVSELHEILDDELKPKHNHFELIKRYKIDEEEEFKMEAGFSNFQKIIKSEVLAKNKHGDIVSDVNGNIFMPLYQSKGDDGFFIIKPCEVRKPVAAS
ncbi:MAG: succinylglutamate desuccinylase/aspartoacylase family protein [Bacteroidia bacterium]|nr:succinylglutamate desuccinylase/aspartoacylase family protein [Bacteroidia bacterium]NNJ55652.1 hypothetical protein [Bacteroidia bacterium]